MEDTTQRLQEAIKAAREGRLAEARGIAEELTEEDPQSAHAWYLRGILAEDEDQQREYLNQALEIDPDHQPARKRMEQLQPVAEEPEEIEEVEEAEEAEEAEEIEEFVDVEEVEEFVEVEEFEDDESTDDMTMVADSAVFMAAVASEVPDEEPLEGFFEQPLAEDVEEEVFEETFDETMIAESPFTEEMTADEIQVEDLFGDEEEQPIEEDDLATVIAAAAFLDDDEVTPDQEEEDAGLQASDLAAAAAGAAVLDEAGEAWFEEEAGDELWDKVEAEAVPDWLIEDTSDQADETLAGETLSDTFPPVEAQPTQEQDLPDWLLDEPDEDWVEVDEVVEDTSAYDEVPATVVTAAVVADEPLEDFTEPAPVEEVKEEPAPAKPKKKKSSADRGIEVALILLIIVAVVIVGALVYFLINPPF